MHRKWERKRDEKKIREWVNRVEFIRRVCGEMNEYETVWALVNVPVQSSLVFLRHYKLHLSLTHSLVNAGSLLLLLLSLSLSLPLSLSLALCCFFFHSSNRFECSTWVYMLIVWLYYIYDENPSAVLTLCADILTVIDSLFDQDCNHWRRLWL